MSNNKDNIYLQVKHINKSFGDVNVLKDISLDCQQGELICLLGPSGCGKTTLLRIIAGLEQQDQGLIIQDDTDISSLPVEKRDFGIVFQSYALFPNLSVAENIAYGLRKQPKKQRTARVKELLQTIGLEQHAKKFPSQLSGGQQQRVALARALAISPGLLLLDEPLSALDTKVRQHLRQEIKNLQRKLGITTIMVTHDQDEAMSMADRIVVLKDGVIEQVGTPNEIYNTPATPFVANFIGTMSFVPATANTSNTFTIKQQSLSCELPEWAATGDAMQLGIRPEHVVALPLNGSPREALGGKVQKVEFMGAYVRLYIHLNSENGSPLSIMADVNDELHAQHGYKENMPVGLQFKPQAMAFYPQQSQTS